MNLMKNRIFFILSALFFLLTSGQAQQLLKGPYLLEPGSREITIRWELDDSLQCKVIYGDGLKQKARLRGKKHRGFLFESVLKNLQPGKKYTYRISCNDTNLASGWFKTTPVKQENIHFVAMGDSRSHPDIFGSILKRVQSDEPDFIISMGDLVVAGGVYEQWGKYYFDVAGNVINHIPLVSCLGDHETSPDDGELFRYFLRKDESTDKQWFSFDYGSAHFVALDYRHADNPAMIDWFKQDMQNTKAKWKFVYMHRPCYNLGGHRSAWGRDIWPALFRRYKVDLIFAGHSHIYERFYPLLPDSLPSGWPLTFVTTGGSGAGLYDVTQSEFLAKAESVNHYVDVFLSGDTLRLQAKRMDGSMLDKMTVIKQSDSYDPTYLAQIKSEDRLNLLTMFMKAISRSVAQVPLKSAPAVMQIKLRSAMAQDVAFQIELSDSSKAFYRMESLSATLKKGQPFTAKLSVFRTTDVRLSPWGEMDPPLRLKAEFTIDGRKNTIIGGAIEYWPDNDDY